LIKSSDSGQIIMNSFKISACAPGEQGHSRHSRTGSSSSEPKTALES